MNNNVADMRPINFSVAGEVLNGLLAFRGKATFKEDFDHFIEFMQQRVKNFLIKHKYSLLNIVNMLQQDAVNNV